MKTTMDLPDDLYQQAKTRAASDRRKIKDLMSEALRLALASPPSPAGHAADCRQVLKALEDIRRCPPLPPKRVAALQSEVRRLRKEGWTRGGEGR